MGKAGLVAAGAVELWTAAAKTRVLNAERCHVGSYASGNARVALARESLGPLPDRWIAIVRLETSIV